MNAIIKASLFKAINEWMNKECEGENWPDIYVSKTSELMTDAAETVFDGVVAIQEYMKKEDIIK